MNHQRTRMTAPKSRLGAAAFICVAVSCAPNAGPHGWGSGVEDGPPPQAALESYRTAAAAVDARPAGRGRAKNVILFVGDGMSVATLTAGRIYAGQKAGGDGESHRTAMERSPHAALSRTYSHDYQVSDSAATATALLSGVRTRSGVVGLSERAVRGVCASRIGAQTRSIFALAEAAGLRTGVVTTARLTHATPAAAFALSPDRDWENDTRARAEEGCPDIAAQLVAWRAGDGLDLALGGGRRNFLPQSAGGARGDGLDLLAVWRGRSLRHTVVKDAAGLAAAPKDAKLLGLFADSHMAFEADRTANEPSLETMTRAAIERLSGGREGYVLLVEAGRIDHAHHGGNAYRALEDFVAFDAAVAAARAMTDEDDTLIIITADHGHTLTLAGYPARGNPILGLARDAQGTLLRGLDGKPYTTLGYANGPGAVCGDVRDGGDCTRPLLTEEAAAAHDHRQQALVPTPSETHGGEDVPVFASGPGAARVGGVMDQPEIFHVMVRALGW